MLSPMSSSKKTRDAHAASIARSGFGDTFRYWLLLRELNRAKRPLPPSRGISVHSAVGLCFLSGSFGQVIDALVATGVLT